MDPITQAIVSYIESTDLTNRPDLLNQAQVAFVDYLASLLAARHVPKVIDLASYVLGETMETINLERLATTSSEQQALWYGFTSHFLDYDDAQANLAGHFSTVIFSALMAVVKPTDRMQDFLTAYVVGAELEGLIGKWINPTHRSQGWHSTATVGPIGAAAAIGRLRGLTGESFAQLLSLGATQSGGMAFQAGTDGKPLHSGLAARNAVWAYQLLEHTSLAASVNPFNNDSGWLKTIANRTITVDDIANEWLQPGQIISPGLWMKVHQYCSAAICGAAGAQEIYNEWIDGDTSTSQHTISQRTIEGQDLPVDEPLMWPHINSVTIHFPPGADKALRYREPTTGREGQFSIEYVIWQILEYGRIQDELFHIDRVPTEFSAVAKQFERVYDIPPVSQEVRITETRVHLINGETLVANVDDPKGSPATPFTVEDLRVKLLQGTSEKKVDTLFGAFKTETIMGPMLAVIQAL